MKRTRKAFTVIKLLVVIAIIVALMGILLPSLSRAREQVRRTVCRINNGGERKIFRCPSSQTDTNVDNYWRYSEVRNRYDSGINTPEPNNVLVVIVRSIVV